jgi:hypothetical protein
MSRRSFALLVMAVIGLVAVVWIGYRVFSSDTPDELADGLAARNACAYVDRKSVPIPGRRTIAPGVHGDFDSRAERIERISYEYLGDVITYYRFQTPQMLARTLGASRSIRRAPLCVLGREVFDGEDTTRRTFRSLCAELHGRVKPPSRPACSTPPMTTVPSTVEERNQTRQQALEDAGGPCPPRHG